MMQKQTACCAQVESKGCKNYLIPRKYIDINRTLALCPKQFTTLSEIFATHPFLCRQRKRFLLCVGLKEQTSARQHLCKPMQLKPSRGFRAALSLPQTSAEEGW